MTTKHLRSGRVLCLLGLWLVGPLALSCSLTELVGSKYVKAEKVEAAEGAIISVSAAEDAELAGVSLIISPGALAETTVITLELLDRDIISNDKPAGPAVKWGPPGTRFLVPAQMTLPLTSVKDEAEYERLFIQVREQNNTSFAIPREQLSFDTQRQLVQFSIDGFTSFQPGIESESCSSAAESVVVSGSAVGLGCASDSDCLASIRYCDHLPADAGHAGPKGIGRRGAICKTAGPADAGVRYAAGYCTQVCFPGSTAADESCPVGAVCVPRGKIGEPADSSGNCFVSCRTSSDCREGYTCQALGPAGEAVCAPAGMTRPLFCAQDSDCPVNEACHAGQCHEATNGGPWAGYDAGAGPLPSTFADGGARGCHSDDECQPGEYCNGSGQCVAPGGAP